MLVGLRTAACFTAFITCLITACGDIQDIPDKSHKAAAAQKEVEVEFPPSICQRHARRNYKAALDTVDSLDNTIVLVGESHGNRNGIEFIHEYILRQLNDNQKVLLGLEAWQNGDFVFDQAWAGVITLDEAWDRLADAPYWKENTDGRQSCAIALLMNDLIQSGHAKKVDLVLISGTREGRRKSVLKGHEMASQLYQRMHDLNMRDDGAVIALTGRNYQRVRAGYTLQEQSTMCGRLRQMVDREVICVGTFGEKTPEKERPCPAGDAFDIMPPEAIEDPWAIYEGLDGVLMSQARCADFTPRALETRPGFLDQR